MLPGVLAELAGPAGSTVGEEAGAASRPAGSPGFQSWQTPAKLEQWAGVCGRGQGQELHLEGEAVPEKKKPRAGREEEPGGGENLEGRE